MLPQQMRLLQKLKQLKNNIKKAASRPLFVFLDNFNHLSYNKIKYMV